MALVHYGQFWKILKIQYYFQTDPENFSIIGFSAQIFSRSTFIGKNWCNQIYDENQNLDFQGIFNAFKIINLTTKKLIFTILP